MKPLEKMTDLEILEAAGSYGPAVIGKALYDRAQQVKQTNPEGKFGPAVVGFATPTMAPTTPPPKAVPILGEEYEPGDIDTALDDLDDEDDDEELPPAAPPKSKAAPKKKAGRQKKPATVKA